MLYYDSSCTLKRYKSSHSLQSTAAALHGDYAAVLTVLVADPLQQGRQSTPHTTLNSSLSEHIKHPVAHRSLGHDQLDIDSKGTSNPETKSSVVPFTFRMIA